MTPSQRKNLNRFFILIALLFITSTASAGFWDDLKNTVTDFFSEDDEKQTVEIGSLQDLTQGQRDDIVDTAFTKDEGPKVYYSTAEYAKNLTDNSTESYLKNLTDDANEAIKKANIALTLATKNPTAANIEEAQQQRGKANNRIEFINSENESNDITTAISSLPIVTLQPIASTEVLDFLNDGVTGLVNGVRAVADFVSESAETGESPTGTSTPRVGLNYEPTGGVEFNRILANSEAGEAVNQVTIDEAAAAVREGEKRQGIADASARVWSDDINGAPLDPNLKKSDAVVGLRPDQQKAFAVGLKRNKELFDSLGKELEVAATKSAPTEQATEQQRQTATLAEQEVTIDPVAGIIATWAEVEEGFIKSIEGLQQKFTETEALALKRQITDFINKSDSDSEAAKKAEALRNYVIASTKSKNFEKNTLERILAGEGPEITNIANANITDTSASKGEGKDEKKVVSALQKAQNDEVVSALQIAQGKLQDLKDKLTGCIAANADSDKAGECLKDDGKTPYGADHIDARIAQLKGKIEKFEEKIASLELECAESKNELLAQEKEKADALNDSAEKQSAVEQKRIENLARLASQKDELEDALNARQISYEKEINKILSELEKLPLQKKQAIRKLNETIAAQNITLNNLENEKQQAHSARQRAYTSMYERCKNGAEGLVKAEIQQVADKISRGTYKVKSAANFHTQSWAKIKRHYESKYRKKTLECFQNSTGLKSVAGITSDTVINSKKSASIQIEAALKSTLDQKDRLIEIAHLQIENSKKQLKDIPETIDNRIKDRKRSQDLLTKQYNANMNSLRIRISRIDQQLMQQTLNQHTQVASINRTIQSALSLDPIIKTQFEVVTKLCSANDPWLVKHNPEKTDQIDNSFQKGIARGTQ